VELEVLPKKNELEVGISHPEQARPGSKVDVTLTLADDLGKPVAGEVTLWLVDEAVLALAREGPLDPLTNLVVRNAKDTSIWDTRNKVVGRVLEEEVPGGDGAADEMTSAEGMARRRVRKNFQTVPFYQATVAVPASGRVVVPVALSDDLTNFVVRAVAVSGAERFGKGESKLKVRLPILVQPQLPRFVRQGDRFDAGGVARLVEGEGGAGFVRAEFTGPVVERKRSRDVALVKDKAVSVTFPVEVASTASQDKLTVKVEVARKKDGVGDAFEVQLPVLPDREHTVASFFAELTPTTRALPAFPEAPRKGTGHMSVVATHMPGLLETFAALEYLDSYPHGCLEQKMARLAPQLQLARLSAQLGGFVYAEGIKGHARRLVEELAAHQDGSGLFGYWPGSSGSLQLTADTLEFIALAESIGVAVDGRLKARTQEALQRSMRSDYSYTGGLGLWRTNLQANAARALTRAGQLDEHYLADMARMRKQLDATARADLALAMLGRQGTFKADLATLKDELWSSVTFNLVDGKRTVVGLSDPRTDWGGFILGSPTSALATVAEALIRLDPGNKDLPLVMEALLRRAAGQRGLGSQASRRGFGSTYDNRRAIAAVSAWLESAAPTATATTLTLDKTTLQLDGGRKVARHEQDVDAPPALSVKGAPVQARVRYRYLPAVTGDRADSVRAGFLVERGMTVYAPGATSQTPRRTADTRAAERTVKVGDILELSTRVVNDQERYNVALVVPFAAGLEPLNPELQTSGSEARPAESDSLTPTYVARLDQEVRYYFDRLPKGQFSFHFRVKALTPGSFVHPGAHAELMYDESVRGTSPGSRLIVARGDGE
jgi:uncharacterized protein YfaS (alpha-2-macroglobulin family)